MTDNEQPEVHASMGSMTCVHRNADGWTAGYLHSPVFDVKCLMLCGHLPVGKALSSGVNTRTGVVL